MTITELDSPTSYCEITDLLQIRTDKQLTNFTRADRQVLHFLANAGAHKLAIQFLTDQGIETPGVVYSRLSYWMDNGEM